MIIGHPKGPPEKREVQRPAEPPPLREGKMPVERLQLGVRIEKRMAKVLKAAAEYLDLSLGELLERIVLHALAGSRAFDEETMRAIGDLKKAYGMEYDLGTIT